MTSLLKCPICGGTERSLLPESVCEECGCDMKPDTSEARRVLFDKSQPKEARMAAIIPMVALLAVCGTAFVLRVLAREIAAAEHKCNKLFGGF